MTYELLTIKLTYPDGSIHDVSNLLVPDSYQEKLSLCGEDQRSSINSIAFSLYYDRDLFLDLAAMTELLGVSVWSEFNSDEIFRGFVDPVGTIQMPGLMSQPDSHGGGRSLSVLDGNVTDDLSYPPVLGDEPGRCTIGRSGTFDSL